MSKILALALKASLEDLEAADDVEYTEADLETNREESIQMLSGQDTADRLNDIADKSDAIADAGEATPATAELMGAAMESLFENHGVVPTTFSFESHGGSSPADYHRNVAANLRAVAKHIETESAVSMEGFTDHLTYAFRGHDKKFEINKRLTEEAVHNFAKKKDTLAKMTVPMKITPQQMSMLWSENGIPKDFQKAIATGHAVAKYFLVDFPLVVKASADSVAAIVNGAKLDSPEGLADLEAKLATVKHPLESAPEAMFKGWPLSYCVGVRKEEAKGSGEGVKSRYHLTTTSNKVVLAKRVITADMTWFGTAKAFSAGQHGTVEAAEGMIKEAAAFFSVVEKSNNVIKTTMKQLDADMKIITAKLNSSSASGVAKSVKGFYNNLNACLLRGVYDIRNNTSKSGQDIVTFIESIVKRAK
jgi:hypothetical protein